MFIQLICGTICGFGSTVVRKIQTFSANITSVTMFFNCENWKIACPVIVLKKYCKWRVEFPTKVVSANFWYT